MNNTIFGLFFVLLGGFSSGIFSVPFAKNKGWEWENNWLIWSIIALVVCPWIFGLVTVPDLLSIYHQLPENTLLVAVFGLIWGVGAVLFGKGIDYLGISLSLPIMQGLINSFGSLTPIIVRNPAELLTPAGLQILLGVVIILVGIVLFAIAGHKKMSQLPTPSEATKSTPKKNIKTGLLICILAGIFGPMINFAFVYGAPLKEEAIAAGASTVWATNAIWSIALTAGFIVNAGQCIYLLTTNGTKARYRNNFSKGMLWASLAGLLWYLSIMFYGMGCSQLGVYAASIGWALMQSMGMLTGNVTGILLGEWKGAPRTAIYYMAGGMAALIMGVLVLAF